ncbi:MAG: hypothetical protein U0X91_07915 [Spirosomataceae bacterium]
MYFSKNAFFSKPSGRSAQRNRAAAFRLRLILPFCVLLCGLLVSERGLAQITVGSTTEATTTNSTTLTFSHTPGAGNNKLLLVAIGVGSTVGSFSIGTDPTPPAVTGVTFDGVAMTLLSATIGVETRSVVYRLLNPPDGPANVVITTASNQIANGTPARIIGTATTFNNVNQTTPLGTPATVSSPTNASSINLTVSSAATDVIYSTVTVDEGVSQAINVPVSGSNIPTILTNTSGNAAVSTATGYKSGTGTNVTTTYNFVESQDHSGIAVAIKAIICPSPNCGTVTLTKLP